MTNANRLVRLFGTSIGRKLVMAGTGILLLGFVIAHMLGNMTLFQSQASLNAYADWLQGHPMVWVARTALLGVFALHIATAVSLTLENRAARPIEYGRKEAVAATLSSRYILFSGLLVLAFVIFHLGHFTLGFFQPEHFDGVDGDGRHDVYGMVLGAFRNPIFSAVYIVAIGIVGFHLHHGIKSLVQTLGFNHESYNGILSMTSRIVVGIIVLGNWSIPILVLAGVVGGAGEVGS